MGLITSVVYNAAKFNIRNDGFELAIVLLENNFHIENVCLLNYEINRDHVVIAWLVREIVQSAPNQGLIWELCIIHLF